MPEDTPEPRDHAREVQVEDNYFAMVPEWILYAPVSDRAVRLYCVLLRFGNRCFPGRDRLAEKLGCSTDSIDRAIKELKEVQALEVTRRGLTQTNVYYVRTSNPGVGRSDDSRVRTRADSGMRADADSGVRADAELKRARKKESKVTPSRRRLSADPDPDADARLEDNPVKQKMLREGTRGRVPRYDKQPVERWWASDLAEYFSHQAPLKTGMPGGGNIKHMSKRLAEWLDSGIRATEVKDMIDLFFSAAGYQDERKKPWVAFMAKERVLLADVRQSQRANEAQRMSKDDWLRRPDGTIFGSESD